MVRSAFCSDMLCAVLEGANPSAEGEDADEGGDTGGGKQILDIEDAFRLNKIEGGMDKKTFTSDMKGWSDLPLQERFSRYSQCGSLHKTTQQQAESC
jgi:Translationally controlled tumour protein